MPIAPHGKSQVADSDGCNKRHRTISLQLGNSSSKASCDEPDRVEAEPQLFRFSSAFCRRHSGFTAGALPTHGDLDILGRGWPGLQARLELTQKLHVRNSSRRPADLR